MSEKIMYAIIAIILAYTFLYFVIYVCEEIDPEQIEEMYE